MRPFVALLSSLLLLPYSLTAQSVCREAMTTDIEHTQGFTIFTVSLPSRPRPLLVKALLPNAASPAGAFVFSLSTLVGSGSVTQVQMMPVAIELAKKGRPTMVLQRQLTWPEVAGSVRNLQAEVLCAEQWLAAHANVKPDDWTFVGPRADMPTLEQLHAVGDKTSMTSFWGFPIGGDEYKNTEHALRHGVIPVAALTDFQH